MNNPQQNLLNKFMNDIEESKKYYIDIMSREDDSAKFIKWIIDNDINPFGVLPDGRAEQMSFLEGVCALYSHLQYCFVDDGDVTFTKITKILNEFEYTLSPKLVFCHFTEKNFQDYAIKSLDLKTEDTFDGVISYKFEKINTLDEFIEEYNRVEEDYKSIHKELFNEEY